ncbi:MAG TPA: hypothetical protein DCG67_07025, partial [Pseudomonas sp.]|nr:hypothetical protein [Pseudomonas sp.]
QAAEAGHAKSMNLVGRCLEDGLGVAADPAAARAWYRRSAEAGDFRGQFSHAAVLLAQGALADARHWLQLALANGHLKFIDTALTALRAAALPELEDIVAAYGARRAALASGART